MFFEGAFLKRAGFRSAWLTKTKTFQKKTVKIFSNFLAFFRIKHKPYEGALEQLEISHILFLSERGISIIADSGPLKYVVLSVTTKTGVPFAY